MKLSIYPLRFCCCCLGLGEGVYNGVLIVWQCTPVSTLNPCNKYLAKHCHSTLTTFGLLPAVVKVKVFVILFWFAHLGFDDSHLSTQRYLLIIFPSHIFLPMSFCFGYLFIYFFLLVWLAGFAFVFWLPVLPFPIVLSLVLE